MVPQSRVKGLEQDQTVRIVGTAQTAGDRRGRGQVCLAGAEQGTDHRIEGQGFLLEVESRGQQADLVTQAVRRLLARTADQGIEPFLDLGSAQRACHESATRPRWTHVFQIGARG